MRRSVSAASPLKAVRRGCAGLVACAAPRSAEAEAIRHLHPENPRFQRLSPDDRLIVSEPFSDLPGVWQEIPQATAVTVQRGGVLRQQPFRPHSPGRPVAPAALSGAHGG